MSNAFDAAARAKLVRLLNMLGSDNAGERDNTARMVGRMVQQCGLDWEDIIAGDARTRKPQPQQSATWKPPPELRPHEWEIAAKQLLRSPFASEWELRFCGDILAFYAGKTLCPRHFETLAWTWRKCRRNADGMGACGRAANPSHV
jgi:hypothetical protein